MLGGRPKYIFVTFKSKNVCATLECQTNKKKVTCIKDSGDVGGGGAE